MAISIAESLAVGFSDFWSRKVRTFVTILGILLGTMSIIVVLALINGINHMTLQWLIERGGLTKVAVHRNWEYNKDNNIKRYFTYKELRLIQSLVPEAVAFNATLRQHFRLQYGTKDFWGSVQGVFPDFKKIEEWDVEEGRFISSFDLNHGNDVICIGTKARDELFGRKNPLGQWITVNGRRLKIIGVMRHRVMDNSGISFSDNPLDFLNYRSLVPYSTLARKIVNTDRVDGLEVKGKDTEASQMLRDKLDSIILNLRKGEQVFRVESAEEKANQMSKDKAVFQVIFIMISAISLLVGGIVIMNIMLATIRERTREIGIRMAVGARRRDVFFQFLIQTVFMTTIGGIIGVLAGLSILDIVSKFLEMQVIANASMVLIGVLISAGVGMIFGIIPAIHASNLNPVEALRYE
ncbi:MAG: ABC transporter permease [Candidatus Cloacimonetes bacterium]|nr:ABC transporter permease [Candidatus Cloacimonadota bacterium]